MGDLQKFFNKSMNRKRQDKTWLTKWIPIREVLSVLALRWRHSDDQAVVGDDLGPRGVGLVT